MLFVWAGRTKTSPVVSPCSLKVEYDKLANEKTEMQRHYVMVRKHRDGQPKWPPMAKLCAGRLL